MKRWLLARFDAWLERHVPNLGEDVSQLDRLDGVGVADDQDDAR